MPARRKAAPKRKNAESVIRKVNKYWDGEIDRIGMFRCKEIAGHGTVPPKRKAYRPSKAQVKAAAEAYMLAASYADNDLYGWFYAALIAADKVRVEEAARVDGGGR